MKLITHIFLKDVRHLWREIAVSLALVVTYGRNVPYSWAHPGVAATGAAALVGAFFDAEFWARMLVVLVPVAWVFTVIRVIQSESLVGDRQFWVTRPYDWRQLLAAKLLFILVFVNLHVHPRSVSAGQGGLYSCPLSGRPILDAVVGHAQP